MKSFLACCFLYCFLALCPVVYSQPAQEKPSLPPYPSRASFADKMKKVDQGMTMEQVRALLGPPDVIQKEGEEGGMWLYGVTTKSGCPSLGTIVFNRNNKVTMAMGGDGSPPPASLISEATLRDLLDVVWGMDSQCIGIGSGYFFDPLTCIKAVNTLLKYPKDQVLAVAAEYRRVCFRNRTNILYALRVLFDPPNRRSFLPEIYDGLEFPPWPANKASIPRYPLAIIDDVPFCLTYGGASVSWISSENNYLPQFFAYLKKHGQLRRSPLHPPSDVLGILDRFASSEQWLFGKDYPTPELYNDRDLKDEEKIGRLITRLQFLRLVRSVLPSSSPFRAYLKDDLNHLNPMILKDWSQLRAELSTRPIQWNPITNDYEIE